MRKINWKTNEANETVSASVGPLDMFCHVCYPYKTRKQR